MEGHVEAFRVLGGLPTRHIRYDNLKPAVRQVLFGRGPVESQRWVAFRSHYGAETLLDQLGLHVLPLRRALDTTAPAGTASAGRRATP